MAVIIFIIVLSVLVFVHELGHFLAAKAFGIRVDEFGFGYPPRARKLFSWRGTEVTLNWLPFGGFVKIFGENPGESPEAPDSFQSRNRGIQALVLVAGVLFNLAFAWILISAGFLIGAPADADIGLPVSEQHLVISDVLAGSPAAAAGLRAGDTIVALQRGGQSADVSAPDQAAAFIAESAAPLAMTVVRGGVDRTVTMTPQTGIVGSQPAVGVAMEEVGTLKLGFGRALTVGATETWWRTVETARALGSFIGQIFVGHADFSQVTGPVGLVGLVGDATALGLSYLLSFTALISINLCLINLLPLPALDGGRLVFVLIEAVTRKRVPPKVFNWINTVGFALLVLLMILVTIRDVSHL